MLAHCIRADSPDPVQDYNIVRQEISLFSPDLLKKKEIILITKTDMISEKDLQKLLKKIKTFKKTIFAVSIYDREKISKLESYLTRFSLKANE